MADGTAHAGQCFSTPEEAAAMQCSSMHGISAGGATSCVGFEFSRGGAFTFNIRTLLADGSVVDQGIPIELMPCETYGFDYWEPVVAAWVVAAIAIVAARMAYERIFGTPTEA